LHIPPLGPLYEQWRMEEQSLSMFPALIRL
jgi:hypothetical protein